MFLSWWRSMVRLAYPTKNSSGKQNRSRVPRKFRSAVRVEQLEDRLVPTTGTANVFLDVGTVSTANTVGALRSTTVPVYIDFNTVTAGSSGGIGGGSFYIIYDPVVLSINESAGALGSDIKLGSLLASTSGYSLAPAAGIAPGVVAIGLSHSNNSFVNGSVTGHLIELDFHVVSSSAVGISTLLDLQGTYRDLGGNNHDTNIHDKANALYTIAPGIQVYKGNLTQTGGLAPGALDPNDLDTTDATIQIITGTPSLAPTTVADTYSMAPNNDDYYSVMTVTGQAKGVLGNDTPAANGPMFAFLNQPATSSTPLGAQSAVIASASEVGMVVTITTAAINNLQPGEDITIANVGTAGYNGNYTVAAVLSSTQFTYTTATLNLPQDNSGGNVSAVATTVYTAATDHGTVWLSAADGSFAYSPTADYTGTDTFTYTAVDAISNQASSSTTVTIYVGGVLYIPKTLTSLGIGDTVVVPVDILNPNPINSGGLANATIAINFDPTVFDPDNITISEGDINRAAGWQQFTVNYKGNPPKSTLPDGQIIITTSDAGGPPPITSTTPGAVAFITFSVLGLPSTGNTSIINLASATPQASQLAASGSGNPVVLPLAFPAQDNTNFNTAPGGPDDGVVTFPLQTGTSTKTTLSASVNGNLSSGITYGTLVTLTATISPTSGTLPPTAGTVDFRDSSGGVDLGVVSTATVVGSNAIFTLVTTPNQLQVLSVDHTISAIYSPGTGFRGSVGKLLNFSVDPALLTIAAVPNTKAFDSGTSAAAIPTVIGLFGTDTVINLGEVYDTAAVGTGKTLTVLPVYTILDNNSGSDYLVSLVSNTAGTIAKAVLTITARANTKAYDATTTAAAIPTVSGLLNGDTVTGLAEVYSSAGAGSSKVLSVSAFTIQDGNGGTNYAVTLVTNSAGVINKAPLTITATQGSKTYDASLSSTITPSVTGLLGNDTVSGLTEAFGNPNVGSGKVLSVSTYTINDGNNGNSYTVTTVTNPNGVILKAPLTITAVANTKAFDGTVTAAATPTVSGLKGSDTVTGLAEVYADPSLGTGKTLSVSAYTVSDGNGGNNYTVTAVPNTAGEIFNGIAGTNTGVTSSQSPVVYGTPVTITITVTATSGAISPVGTVEVVANGADLGSATLQSSSGLISTWIFTTLPKSLNASGVGGITITGAFSGNSNFSNSTGTLAGGQTVTPKSLTITATANAKTYDSTAVAGATPTVSGLVTGDTVTGLVEVYASPNAGTSKALSVSAYTITDGNGGNNYTVTTLTNTTGVINKALLTITAATNSKTYDSTTSAVAAPTVSGLIGSDKVSGLVESYANAGAGSSKTLSVSAFAVNDGNGGNNYAVTTVANTTGVITKVPLTITASPNTKAFDGTVSAAAVPAVTGLQGGDSISGLSESYDNPNPGTGKTLSINAGYTINDGNSGNNYTLSIANNLAGAITGSVSSGVAVNTSQASVAYGTPVTFTITVTANGGTLSPTGTVEVFDNASHDLGAAGFLSSNGLVSTWTLTTLAKTLNVTSPLAHVITANFTAAGAFSSGTGSLTGGQVVTPQALTLKAAPNTKTYDSTTTAAATPIISAGLVTGDSVTNLTEAYTSAAAGSTKTETITGYTVNDGNGGNNYSVTTLSDATGLITKASVTITAAANTKAYDGGTAAAATPTVAGLKGNDAVTGLAEVYANAGVGSNKTLSVSSYTVSDGNNGNNYSVTTIPNTAGVVTKATVTITATTNIKTYDGTASAAAVPTVSGLLSGDSVTGLSESYSDSKAGTGKTLSVNSGYTIQDGNGGSNYSVILTANTSGVINKATITITAQTNTKTYNGSATAAAVPTVAGLLGGDTLTGLSESYANANAGSSKTLSVNAGYTVNDGNGGNNYTVLTSANTTGVINKASLSITALTNTKAYDRTTSAAAVLSVVGLIGSDTVTGLTESYADAQVGTGKLLSVNQGYTINDGNGGSNYSVALTTNATGVINKASITIVPSNNSKTFDSTTTAAAIPTVVGLLSGDTVTGLSESYTDANAGSGKTLSVNPGYTVSDGNGGNNYVVSVATSTGGVIFQAPLAITVVPNTKAYDGNLTAAAIPTVSGLQGNDKATGLTEVYADSTAGTGKTLSVSAFTIVDGNNGGNYAVITVPKNTGVINPPASNLTIMTPNPSGVVIQPPQGTPYIYNLTVMTTQPLDFTVTYQTINGTAQPNQGIGAAMGGNDFTTVASSVVHINNSPIHTQRQTTAIVPITILGSAPEQPGGPTVKTFTVKLTYSVSNGSGNAVAQQETAFASVNIQQVFAPTISVPASQSNVNSQTGPYLSFTSYYTPGNINPAFTPMQYAQGAGDVYVNYNSTLAGASNPYSSVSVKIPYANFASAGGNFTIPNYRLPANQSGSLTLKLAAVTPNAALVAPTSGTVTFNNPQLAAGAPTGAPGGAVLNSVSQISSVVSTAESQWVAAGANPAAFKDVQIQIGTTGQGVLGNTAGNVITIDPSAAGFGWYLGTTNGAFQPTSNSANQVASPGSPAAGHMDLLTVVEHELGHILGYADVAAGAAPDSLMTVSLSAGMRRTPPVILNSVASVYAAPLVPSNMVSTLLSGGPPPTKANAPSYLPIFIQPAAAGDGENLAALNQAFAVLGAKKSRV
jgi:YDG domain